MPDAAYSTLSGATPLVVFEGVTLPLREAFGRWMVEMDFSQTILACAAIEPPYEVTSTLEDVKDEAARKEIQRYRDFYQEKVASSLLLDHVYATTLRDELKEST